MGIPCIRNFVTTSAEYFSPTKIEKATIKINEGGNKTKQTVVYTLWEYMVQKKGTIQNVLKLAKSLHTAIHRNTKKSQFSAMCIKLWPLSVEVCKGTRFYPDFLHFKTIDKRNKDVVNITPLKMLSKNLKKLDGNLTSNIKVHVVF